MPENENEQRPSALLGDWFVSTPESEAMLAEEIEALRQAENDWLHVEGCNDLCEPLEHHYLEGEGVRCNRHGQLDRSVCGFCHDAYVECTRCGVYSCPCNTFPCEPEDAPR